MKQLNKLSKWLIAIALVFVLVGLARADDWGYGAGLVPPGVTLHYDGLKLVETGLNTEGGGGSVSVFKGKGLKYFKAGLDSYFEFVEGKKGCVGIGAHVGALEKGGWTLVEVAIIGWISRPDDVNYSVIFRIGLPNIYERE